MAGSSLDPRLNMTNLRLRNTRRQGRTCIPYLVSSSRRPSIATRGAPQYRESGDGDSSPSSDDDETEDYRVVSRKRNSTDREPDDDNGDNEEIEEEEAPLVQYPP